MSWPVVKLGDVSERVDYGLTASAIDKADGPRFLRITDLQNDSVDWDEVPSCDCTPKEFEGNKLAVGDIVFARTGATTGKSFLIRSLPKPSVFASYLIRVRPDATVDSGYLSHFFKSPIYWNQITNMANGAAQPGVNSSKLKELEIPLPPLAEQKRIAAILDKADTIRRKRQQAIQLADDFLRAVFLEMFGDPVTNPKGWEVLKFEAVGKLDRGKSKHRPRNDPKLLGGEHPLIQTGDVANSGGYIKIYSSTYSDFGLAQSRKWPAGTLCITIAANIAKTGILTFDACFPDSVVGFTPNKLVTTEYVQMWLGFLQKILENSAPESAQKNINLEILRGLTIPVPPIELQSTFSSAVEKMNSVKEIFDSGVSETNCFFSSLSQKAFSGQL
ncbi:restriction endonuclease subunit S [Vibrio cholerae]|nr:restriction endonuclease subunit S [Vibrio cholerae]